MNSDNTPCEPYELPSGNTIYQLNPYETEFVFHEIFKERTYLKNGITLKPNGVVLDIGANIGLFTLFVKQECPSAKVFAYEPVPDVYDILRRNTLKYGSEVRVFNCGISRNTGSLPLTHYPGYSVVSGFQTNADRDLRMIVTGMKGAQNDPKIRDSSLELLVEMRLQNTKTFDCKTLTVSKVIADQQLERIELLKIDAEGSELGILEGIAPRDWDTIQQVVMELHNPTESETIGSLLRFRGFDVVIESDPILGKCGISTAYARRP